MLYFWMFVCFSGGFEEDPARAVFITSDIERFWIAFDKLPSETNPFIDYLENGSQGLKDFIPDRIQSADFLLEIVTKEREYYQSIRASTLKTTQFLKQIQAGFYALEYWYPKATWPPVYFVIGATTSGGTASKNGMIIGMEIFSDHPTKTAYGRPTLDLDLLPYLVNHEVIHFLQRLEAKTLLDQSLLEGSADFLAEMFSGEKVKYCNGPIYEYGDKHEKALWAEFQQLMNQEEYGQWLYGIAKDGRPQNLGYWMGYQITKAYFDSAPDKRQAVAEIIEMTDSRDFLKKSGYSSANSR